MIYGFHLDGSECHNRNCALPHRTINEGMDVTHRWDDTYPHVRAEEVLEPRRAEYEKAPPVALPPELDRALSKGLALASILRGEDTETWIKRRAPEIAEAFHETYERLAPNFGYQTRERSAVPWGSVPDDNKALMIATAEALLREGKIA